MTVAEIANLSLAEEPVEIASPGRGRPALFEDRYCDGLVNHVESGGSLNSYAVEVKVSRRTLGVWGKRYPEFSDAMERAKTIIAARLEKDAQAILAGEGGPGAASLCMFMMKNFSPHDYEDRQTHEHVGRIGHHPMTREEAIEEARRRGLPTRIFEE